MITIREIDDNKAELIVDKGTQHSTMLLGIEMLIEALLKESKLEGITIDDILEDLKRIYERDNKKWK